MGEPAFVSPTRWPDTGADMRDFLIALEADNAAAEAIVHEDGRF